MEKNEINKTQILLTCRTHEMIKAEFPDYSEPDSKVPNKDFHLTLGLCSSTLNPNGFQLFMSDNVNYTDYLAMLKYLSDNPLSEKVFAKMQENIKIANYDTL